MSIVTYVASLSLSCLAILPCSLTSSSSWSALLSDWRRSVFSISSLRWKSYHTSIHCSNTIIQEIHVYTASSNQCAEPMQEHTESVQKGLDTMCIQGINTLLISLWVITIVLHNKSEQNLPWSMGSSTPHTPREKLFGYCIYMTELPQLTSSCVW